MYFNATWYCLLVLAFCTWWARNFVLSKPSLLRTPTRATYTTHITAPRVPHSRSCRWHQNQHTLSRYNYSYSKRFEACLYRCEHFSLVRVSIRSPLFARISQPHCRWCADEITTKHKKDQHCVEEKSMEWHWFLLASPPLHDNPLPEINCHTVRARLSCWR